MKRFILLIALNGLVSSVFAEKLPPTPDLQAGTANYQTALDWSKERIISENQSRFSPQELNDKLISFPLITNEKCGDFYLMFVQNTPKCGNINCPFLTFKKVMNPDQGVTYQYLDEIWFSSTRLYCFPRGNGYKYYLVTSYHDSNEVSFLELNEFKNNKFQKIKSREVHYSQPEMSQKMDEVWDRKLNEKALLNFFGGSNKRKSE